MHDKTKAGLFFLGEESLVFDFCPREGLFSSTGVRWIPSPRAVLARGAIARDIIEVHCMLTHPSEEITWKMAEAVGIATMGQWRSCEACLQAKVK